MPFSVVAATRRQENPKFPDTGTEFEHLMAFGRAEGGNLKPEEKAEGGNLKPEKAADTGDFQLSAFSRQPSAAAPQVSGLSFHPSTPSSISHLLSSTRLLVLDFDGVLTDNRVLVSEDGKESVLCDRGDGLGIGMLKTAGIQVVVISKERNPVVAARCRKLGIECIQGCDDKLGELKKRAEGGNMKPEDGTTGTQVSGLMLHPSPAGPSGLILHPSPAGPSGFRFHPSSIAYVGNDVNDLECMRWVGLPIAVADAAPEVLAIAKIITTKRGGHGAVREICDLLLRAG